MNAEQQYVKGFNTGYLLSNYEPTMLNGMVKSLPSTGDFFTGLFAGQRQLEQENIKVKLNEISKFRDGHSGQEREV